MCSLPHSQKVSHPRQQVWGYPLGVSPFSGSILALNLEDLTCLRGKPCSFIGEQSIKCSGFGSRKRAKEWGAATVEWFPVSLTCLMRKINSLQHRLCPLASICGTMPFLFSKVEVRTCNVFGRAHLPPLLLGYHPVLL